MGAGSGGKHFASLVAARFGFVAIESSLSAGLPRGPREREVTRKPPGHVGRPRSYRGQPPGMFIVSRRQKLQSVANSVAKSRVRGGCRSGVARLRMVYFPRFLRVSLGFKWCKIVVIGVSITRLG